MRGQIVRVDAFRRPGIDAGWMTLNAFVERKPAQTELLPPQPGDMFWSPADWAWAGGLMDALLPSWNFGIPILGYRGRFDAEKAYYLLEKYGVRNAFLFPTALKLMMKAVPEPKVRFDIARGYYMYRDKFANPYVAASWGYVDDVIEPKETRPRLINALEMLRNKRDTNPPKKHGNIPL